ncbi:MAG: hypothetical protein LBB40_02815 [Holophagales bacterium]|jgi:hypothetical protein|nr:hypothetical protein [Holophagales bacterium]
MKLTPALFLLCALAGTGVLAQTPEWSMGGRVAFGATLAGKEPQNTSGTIGGGLWVEKTMSEASAVFCEFNYQYFQSVQREATKFGLGYYPVAVDSTHPTGTAYGFITNFFSADMRKDQLDGYGIMLGYRKYFDDTLSAHFGFGYTMWISFQEALGEVNVQNAYSTTASTIVYREGLNHVVSVRGFQPVIYSGVRYNFTPNAAVEGNARFITWKQANYVPFAYTGFDAHTESKTRTKVTFDISLSIRF